MLVEPLHAHGPVLVVGYDGSAASRAAVRQAIDQVRAGGHLVIVHAFEVADDFVAATYRNFALQDAAEGAAERLYALAGEEPALAEVSWEHKMVRGVPAQVLCRVAQEHDASAILIGTRGQGRVGSALLGSVAQAVLHAADRPVTVFPQRMLERSDQRQVPAAGVPRESSTWAVVRS